jgi:hypothetical protein
MPISLFSPGFQPLEQKMDPQNTNLLQGLWQ